MASAARTRHDGAAPSRPLGGVPEAVYLFAMKCRAMRRTFAASASLIGLKTADEAMDLVLAFYPKGVIEPKTQLGLQEIFATMGDAGPEAP